MIPAGDYPMDFLIRLALLGLIWLTWWWAIHAPLSRMM